MSENTKGGEPTFRYELKKDIREFMEKHKLTYESVYQQLGFSSRQTCRSWLLTKQRCVGLEALQGFEDLKVIHE